MSKKPLNWGFYTLLEGYMPVYDKNKTRALFKQLNQFKKIIDKEKVKQDGWYKRNVQEIVKNIRRLILDSIPVDQLDACPGTWDPKGVYFRLGTMLSSSKYEAKRYWPQSIKRAIKENDYDQLRLKTQYYYKDGKYYGHSDYFLDSENKIRAKDKYYCGQGNVAYPKEKYIFATKTGTFFIKKQTKKQKYEKKIPVASTVTIRINNWGNLTPEFLWSMFEYDGKMLPDLTREQYGFSFNNIKKLKFVPTKEHLSILKEFKKNEKPGYLSDDDSVRINIYCKEKKHIKAIGFLQAMLSSWQRTRLSTIQEKLNALSKVADLEEEEQNGL